MIKNMNGKMITKSQLSTTKPKKTNILSKQVEEEHNHRNGDHMEGYQQGGDGGNGGKGTGNKYHKW